MSKPAATFPASVWNGLSANFARLDRNAYQEPDPDDWDRAVSELVATQAELARYEAKKDALPTAVDGATVTFDMSLSDRYRVTIAGNRAFVITGDVVGQEMTILVTQGSGGSRLVSSWFAGSTVSWAGGSAPTLTTTAGKTDVIKVLKTGPLAYVAWVPGQNA